MTIEIETAKKYYYTNLIYELHIAEEKLSLFKKKYQANFDEFEKSLKNQKEDFLKWDDYLEWKAFRRVYDELKKNKISESYEININDILKVISRQLAKK